MRKVDSWSPLAPGHPRGGMQGGCALAGLRALLTSQLLGCVTGRVPACRPPPVPDGLPVNWGGTRETRLRVPGWALSSHPSSESGRGRPPVTSSDKRGPGCGLCVWTSYFKFFPPRKEGQKKAARNWAWESDACQRRGGGGRGEKQPLAQVCSTERGKGLQSFPRALPGQGDSSRGWSVWVQPGGPGSARGWGQSGPGRGYPLVQMVDSRKSRGGEQKQACTEVWDRMCLPHLLPAPAT